MDLSLVPMDDMVNEIKSRFDTVVILTQRQIDKDNDDLHYHYKNKVGILGLLEISKKDILDDYVRKETGSFDE